MNQQQAADWNPKPTVLYDGGCPMCSREIRHYRKLAGAENIAWIDVADAATTMPIDGVDRDTAMAAFHVRDSSGVWQTGAYGFVELWSHLRGYRHLASSLRFARLLPLLDAAYHRFARWRLNRRCDSGTCTAIGHVGKHPSETGRDNP
jgi:predicted DCC family thiol-disulfide oxidoreductase YuxK